MFRKWIIMSLSAIAFLAVAIQTSPVPAASVQAQSRRYGVQFRQPEWRDQAFGSPDEMNVFIDSKRRNGWDVQEFPGELRVRYRLVQWGGSRFFDNLADAQQWAAYLEEHFGYQPRVVTNP